MKGVVKIGSKFFKFRVKKFGKAKLKGIKNAESKKLWYLENTLNSLKPEKMNFNFLSDMYPAFFGGARLRGSGYNEYWIDYDYIKTYEKPN